MSPELSFPLSASSEGYIFEVTIDEDGNAEIEYVGKGEAVGPRVINIQVVNSTTSSVEIEVETIRAEGATYTYSYKKVSEDEYTVPEGQDNNSNRYNYTGLEANETYNFKVEVTDSEGRKADGITNWTTATIPSGDEGIVVGEITWSGGKASVTVTTDEEGYDLEYQKNDGGWQPVPGNGVIGDLDHGDVVDIRLTDGTNYGEETTINIEDTEDPIIVEFKETTITESSIAVSVTASDNSGGTLTYEYKIGDGAYTAGTNTSTHTFEGLVAGKEYEMVVRVTDQAGRSVTKTLTKTTNAMPGKDTISVSLTSWANGQATITVSTTDPKASMPFNLSVTNTLNTTGTLYTGAGALQTYLVDNDGYINFPVVGKVKVGGLTKRQCENRIKENILPYMSKSENPIVTVKMASFKVAVPVDNVLPPASVSGVTVSIIPAPGDRHLSPITTSTRL